MFRCIRQCVRIAAPLSQALNAPTRNVSSKFAKLFPQNSKTEKHFPTSFYGFRLYATAPDSTVAQPKLPLADIQERIVKVCKNFDKITADKLTLESNFMSDLGLDSLDHVELIMAIEDEFGFEISDTEAEKLLRPSDIIKYVQMKQSQPGDDVGQGGY